MNAAKTRENSPGPTSMAMLRTDPSAPCSSPCSEAETRCVIIDCEEGPASDHRPLTGMAARKSQPTVAPPKSTKPSAPRSSPERRARRSPNRATTGPTTPAEMAIELMPTMASERPIFCSFQP